MWTAEQIGPLLPNVSTWPKGWDTTDPEERREAAVWLAETFNRINSTMTPDKGAAMSERPTPAQIAATLWAEVRTDPDLDPASLLFTFLVRLDQHGYVIVHPDDVPESQIAWMNEHSPVYDEGWNDCRRSIFGGSHE